MKKDGIDLLADYVFLSKYSQRNSDGRLEHWHETIERIYAMHEVKLNKLGLWNIGVQEMIHKAMAMENDKKILSSQRGRQFASPVETSGILKHEAKLYNCCSTYIDRIEVFSEIMYLLLCGCGVGYSLHKEYIDKLPVVKKQIGEFVTYKIEDSIEGWGDSIKWLMENMFNGRDTRMDFTAIRPEGALIDGKFVAPGPEPLIKAHENIKKVMLGAQGRKLTSIEVHDIICFIADSVVSGGVRRSAMIALFDKDDDLMLRAKTGSWWTENPQRAMANNSILTSVKDRLSYKEMKEKLQVIRQFGEPGVVNVADYSYTVNPCLFGGTIVGVANGENGVRIDELAKRRKWVPVYYKKKTGAVAITEGFAFCKGKKKVIKLVLSDGSDIICTPEHKILMSNGQYVEARKTLGKTLSKFFTSNAVKYRTVNSFTNGYSRQYRMIWEYYNGVKPNDFDIDHINNDGGDFIENLQAIPKTSHNCKSGMEKKGDNNPVHRMKRKSVNAYNLSCSTSLEKNGRFLGLSNEDMIEIGKQVVAMGLPLNFSTCRSMDDRWPSSFSKNRFGGSFSEFVKYVTGEKTYERSLENRKQIKINPTNKFKHLKDDVRVVSIEEAGEELVYDITVRADEHNFAIITHTEDENYINCSGTFVHNCGEIVMKPSIDGKSGFAFCNLVEINAERVKTEKEFYEACKVASFVATLQSLYTDFKYLSAASREIAERDRAIGVSITGIYANPILQGEVLKAGAKIVAETNAKWAEAFGINRSRTCTTIKPSGNASSILGLYCSGIHPAHATKYLRRVRIKTYSPEFIALKDTPMVKVLRGDEAVISFPIEVKSGWIVCKDSVSAVEHLKFIGMVKHYWINKGSIEKKAISNNISATVEVRDDEWDEVAAVLFTNDYLFTGVSLLPKLGDQIYDNAPFQRLSSKEVKKEFNDIKQYLEANEVDFNVIMSNRDNIYSGDMVAVGCSGGSCELK